MKEYKSLILRGDIMLYADSYYKYKAENRFETLLLPELSGFDKFLWKVKGYEISKLPDCSMPNEQAINLLLHIGNNIDKIADNEEDAEVYLQAIEKAVSVLKD